MKKIIKIALLFLLIAKCPFKAEAFFGYQILHLKVFSYPAGAGKFSVANYYFGYEQGECLNHYQKYGENLSVKDYFEMYVKEDSYRTELDTLMMVAYMDGYGDGYLVKVKPVDENYTFLGFVHSKYIGEQYDFWYYYQHSNEYPYYRPLISSSRSEAIVLFGMSVVWRVGVWDIFLLDVSSLGCATEWVGDNISPVRLRSERRSARTW